MPVDQLAVFIENKPGRLAEITSIIAAKGVNIRTLSLADTADFGIFRLIVDKVETARAALKENGFLVRVDQVLAVEVPDRVGGLAKILQDIDAAGLNVEYMYAFVNKLGDGAVLIFRFERIDAASEVLTKTGCRLLSGEEVRAL
jgi:hypothetical protein